MKVIMKREIQNYVKNPVFWIGVLIVLAGVYLHTSPYLEVKYFQPEEELLEKTAESMGDADIMQGYIPTTKEEQKQLGYAKIKNTFIEEFRMSESEAEAVILEMEEKKLSMAEIPVYLEENYSYVDKYVFLEQQYRKGTAEEVNVHINQKLEEHPFSFYFSRKFADFAGLFLGFFATILLAFLFIRDTKRDTYELLHTKPVSAGAYLWGKVAGGFFALVLVLGILILVFGLLCGFHAKKEGFPMDYMDMVRAAACYILPNMLMVTSVYAGVAILFKNPLPALPLLFLYLVYSNMGSRNAEGIYGYYGRPLAIMVRFPGNFFDTSATPYVMLNQIFLMAASIFLILLAAWMWKRRRVY